jgi:hypothetical protein
MALKEDLLAYLIASVGWILAFFYLLYEYLVYGPGFYEHLVRGALLEHVLMALGIPLFMFIGYLFKRESQFKRERENYARELKKAGEMKDLFVDILRHDLLNSIGIIKNVAELLGDNPSLKGAKEVDMIKRNAAKLEEIVKMASTYADLANDRDFDYVRRDINPMVDEAVKDFKSAADEKNIKIEINMKGSHVVKSAPFIEEVFYNIISNAVKYSPRDSKIWVSVDDVGDKVRFVVKDQGPGVEDEHKEKIFERFYRGGKEGIKGTGLGLAIVKRIVDLHKGKVWVEDNPEGGSIFIVEIPKNF